MAFLCPVRVGKGRRKRTRSTSEITFTHGRITGSSSIDTLVRVGLEKENSSKAQAKMMVLHDFVPCVDDELEVKRGQHVNVLYKENDWIYVIGEDDREGFIPHTYVVPLGNSIDDMALNVARRNSMSSEFFNKKSSHTTVGKMTKAPSLSSIQMQNHCHVEVSNQNQIPYVSQQHSSSYNANNTAEAEIFTKRSFGRYIALFKFTAGQENDVSVERGDFVTVLNKDDIDWFWVMKTNKDEGFVPSAFLCPAEGQPLNDTNKSLNSNFQNVKVSTNPMDAEIQRLSSHGTKLVTLYDYVAQSHDDLTVTRGQYIFADLENQDQSGWIWAYSPSARRAGYVPKAYAKPPNVTNL